MTNICYGHIPSIDPEALSLIALKFTISIYVYHIPISQYNNDILITTNILWLVNVMDNVSLTCIMLKIKLMVSDFLLFYIISFGLLSKKV